jgi:hypothetical protein
MMGLTPKGREDMWTGILMHLFLVVIIATVEVLDETATLKDHVIIVIIYFMWFCVGEVDTHLKKIYYELNRRWGEEG